MWPFKKKKIFYTYTPQFYKKGQHLRDGKIISVTLAYMTPIEKGTMPCFKVTMRLNRKEAL
jgi:hypothetical protein